MRRINKEEKLLNYLVEQADSVWVSEDVYKWKEILKQSFKDKQDLENFTKLIVRRRIDLTVLDISINAEDYNHHSTIYDRGWEFYLLEKEFEFAKKMLKKYEKISEDFELEEE